MKYINILLVTLVVDIVHGGRLLLYGTKANMSAVEQFNCIFYYGDSTVKYCERPSYPVFRSNREGTNCTNGTTGYSFFDLRSREITADEVQ
jgi:hypothetical protein